WSGQSKRQVNDLYEDLRDGHNLISLLELLSGEMLPRHRDVMRRPRIPPRERGSMLVHKMQNIKIALDFMQRRQIKLVNIRSDDIAEGNPKLTLGLIWTIILHFQVSDIQVGEQHRDLGAKERLLLWVRRVVQEYPDLRCDNFTTSWRDGRLFNAIIHRHRPDLLDMKKVYQQNNQQNLEQAFSLAEQNLRVPRLLDTEDVDVKSPEEKSLVTYVAALYEAFPKIPADGITIYEVDKKWKEYETKISFLLSWIKEKMQKVESQGSTMSREEDFQILLLQLKEKDIPGRDGERASIEKLYKALQVWIDFGRIKVTPGQSPADVEKELGKLVKAIQAGETKAQQETSRLTHTHLTRALLDSRGPCEEQAKEAEAKAKAQEEARAKAKAEALAKAQEEEKARIQADAAAKALADSIAKQQEEAKAKEAEAKEREAVKAKEAEDARLRVEAEARALAESLSKAQAEGKAKEAEAKAQAEADQKLNFIKDLMALMEEKQMEIESADWGIDLSSVGANLQSHKNLHQVLEGLNTKVVEAQAYESKVPASRKKNYTDSLAALTATYNKSLAASGVRSTRLQELLAFLAPAEAELAWAK
uniref:Calponin-homology (CH) domain-containing protein n=1 Tax=Petromyzon marinus TaxID=7757 RepID=S4RJQ3_PETMA